MISRKAFCPFKLSFTLSAASALMAELYALSSGLDSLRLPGLGVKAKGTGPGYGALSLPLEGGVLGVWGCAGGSGGGNTASPCWTIRGCGCAGGSDGSTGGGTTNPGCGRDAVLGGCGSAGGRGGNRGGNTTSSDWGLDAVLGIGDGLRSMKVAF